MYVTICFHLFKNFKRTLTESNIDARRYGVECHMTLPWTKADPFLITAMTRKKIIENHNRNIFKG